MSDLRLIVAGAGGRMGRTLIHTIAAIDGATLAGAVEAAGSAVIGRDAGELAGLGKNGGGLSRGGEALLPAGGRARGLTRAAGPPPLAGLPGRRGVARGTRAT